jgi:hypothetical protein
MDTAAHTPNWNGFGSAWMKVWRFFLAGIILGLLCILPMVLYGGKEKAPVIALTLVEHIGMGFIVASVAVLLYEWVGHWNDPLDISAELKAIRVAVERNALYDVVYANLRGTGEKREILTQAISSIVERFRDLSSDGDWGKEVYIKFLREVLVNLRENAAELFGASDQTKGIVLREYGIVLYPPAQRTSTVLADLMRRLSEDSKYSATSDLASWKNHQLKEFFDESLAAAEKRKVIIRRIFILDQDTVLNDDSFDEAEATINKHLEATKRPGSCYQVRLLDEPTVHQIKSKCDDERAAVHVYKTHVGIFEHAEHERCIRVRVHQEDLDRLYFAALPRNSDEMRQFDDVWVHLETLTSEKLALAITKWKARVKAGKPPEASTEE